MPEQGEKYYRLDKILADAGIGTRRELKKLIPAGRVTVDGQVVRQAEQKVLRNAQICVDGRAIDTRATLWLLLHKPAGYVTSTDEPGAHIVMELLAAEDLSRGVFPVGRLDKQTEGLLLFTNDGAAAHRLLSPQHRVAKVYYVEHEGQAGPEDVESFAQGMVLRDGSVCLPGELEPLGPGKSRVTIYQGMYHQVRRMMAARGMHVTYLRREAEAGLTLQGVPCGQYRRLSPEEEARLAQL